MDITNRPIDLSHFPGSSDYKRLKCIILIRILAGYRVSLPAGLGSNDIGLDRGLSGGGRIVKFSKVGRKVLLVQPNYDYRAVTNDVAEKRAVEESFAQSTLWGFTEEAETADRYLVDVTDFLLRDAMQMVNRIRGNQQVNAITYFFYTPVYYPSILSHLFFW